MPTRFTDALEPLVPTVVQMLEASVRRNEEDDWDRGMLAYLLRVLPLLNREACELWRAEYEALPLLTLCGYLFRSGHRRRYLDGVLPDAANDPHNWTEPLDPELMPAPQHIIALESIFENRERAALELVNEAARNHEGHRAALRFGLSIVQDHQAFRQHPSYSLHFGTCQRVGCHRPALLSTPDAEAPEPQPDEDDLPGEAEYWKCCRDGRFPPPQSNLPSDMCFCSYGCFRVTNAEFRRVVKFDISTPLCATRRGAGPTPERLFRAAVKRNIGLARELRMAKQVETTHYPVLMANREQLLRQHTTMLSVDLGVLYAAHLVQELPARLRPDRPLPCTEDWRKHGACYLNAVTRVRDVYMKYGRGELARGANEFWLKRLRDRLLEIF